MSLITNNTRLQRSSDPGAETEYQKYLETEYYLDYSDIAQLNNSEEEKREIEKNYHAQHPFVKRSPASENVANASSKSSLASCDGSGH